MLATSSNGCKDSIAIGTLNIVELENYSITSSSNSGCPPLQINFDLTPNQNIQQILGLWRWKFCKYNTKIRLTIMILVVFLQLNATITDANGCIQQQSSNNNITVAPTPTATTVVTNNVGCPPLNVQFDVITNSSNTILLDYGDTTVTSSNFNSSYNYVNSGTYYPTLQITDVNGCQSNYNLDTVQAGLTLTNFIAKSFYWLCSSRSKLSLIVHHLLQLLFIGILEMEIHLLILIQHIYMIQLEVTMSYLVVLIILVVHLPSQYKI